MLQVTNLFLALLVVIWLFSKFQSRRRGGMISQATFPEAFLAFIKISQRRKNISAEKRIGFGLENEN